MPGSRRDSGPPSWVDDVALLLVDPPSDGDDEELQGLRKRTHTGARLFRPPSSGSWFRRLKSSPEARLLNMPLPVLPENQEVLVLEIDLTPGQASQPHRHNAHVFVYVLEGQINMQVEGGELVTLSQGEMFYENPDDIHVVSENASDSEPAKFLVHIIKTVGVPISAPVP